MVLALFLSLLAHGAQPAPEPKPAPAPEAAPAPAPAPPRTVGGPRSAPEAPPAAEAPAAPPEAAAPAGPAEAPEVPAPPAPAGPPLAIPGGKTPPPLGPPPGAGADADAIRRYRMQMLAVRGWSELHATTVYQDVGYSWGYPGHGWGTTVGVATPFVWREDRVAVYRGPQRLSNPDYLGVIGKPDEKADLERRIRKSRTASTALYGVAVAGAAATVASWIGMENALIEPTYRDWQVIGGVGLAGLVGGAVTGSIPAGRARRLSTDPTAIRDWEPLESELLHYNEQLRVELGLSDAEAVRIEGEGPR